MFTATCEKYPQLRVHGVCRFRDGTARVNADQAEKLRRLSAEYGIEIEDSVEADKPLEKRSPAELKAYATDQGIDLGGATKKADILAAISAAEKPEADEESSDQS